MLTTARAAIVLLLIVILVCGTTLFARLTGHAPEQGNELLFWLCVAAGGLLIATQYAEDRLDERELIRRNRPG